MKTGILIATAVMAAASTQAMAKEAITEADLQLIDTNKDGVVTKQEYVAYMDAAFDALDENNSGRLTAADFDILLTPAEFSKMDADGNGSVSRAEFDAQMAKDFDAADQDGNGTLD